MVMIGIQFRCELIIDAWKLVVKDNLLLGSIEFVISAAV